MARRTSVAAACALGAWLALAPTAGAQSADATPRPALADEKADPNDWRSYYEEGVRVVQRDARRAEALFVWASRLSPSSAEPVLARWVALNLRHRELIETPPGKGIASIEERRRRVDSVYHEALTIDPFTPRHYVRYVDEARPGYWQRDLLTQGYLAYTEARYERALDLLARVRGERQWPARMYRALSFYAMERYDSAAAELQLLADLTARANAATLAPVYESAAVYHYGIGTARLRLGDLDGARDALHRALAEDASLAAAHVALAQVARQRGDTAELLREWALALELRPTSGAMHGDYGNALRAIGRLQEAASEYERAIALEPHWANPYFNLALVLEQLGRPADAVPRYAQFLDRAPRALEAPIRHARSRLEKLNGSW